MHPTPVASSTTEPPDPMQSLASQLDDVMAQAEIAANAERDLEAEQGTPTATSEREESEEGDEEEEGSGRSEGSSPAEQAQEESEDEEESADGEGEEEQPSATPPEQPKYSRRDAARFATELESTRRERDETRAQLESHRGELAAIKDSDQRIRAHLQKQSGYVREDNGRFRYENLSEKVLKGTATPEEAEEVQQMTAWHEFAGPIFRAAEEQVLGSFAARWNALGELDGIGQDGLKKLNEVKDVTEGAKLVHQLAFAAGETKAKQQYEAKIARLTAENKSLKTKRVAGAPQPASSNGAAVPAKTNVISRMIDPKTGLPNPEFDREVGAGKWLGADLAQ